MSYAYSDHLGMMRSGRRMAAYRDAIAAVVRPGDTVLDLGAGAGVMTFLALEAGAAHVHAIEPSPNVEVLRRVARANGLLDRVTIHREDSRRVRLPAPADVLIADLRGALPVYSDGVAVVLDARARHLRPDGRTIPLVDRLFAGPVEHPSAHDNVAGWRARYGGADYASMSPVAANAYCRAPFAADALLAPGALIGTIPYDGSCRGDFAGSVSFEVTRAGRCHGVGAWFETDLAPGVTLSTAPELEELVYGQGYFPVEHAVDVAPGDTVALEMSVRIAPAEPVWQWRVLVESGGAVKLDERHCSLDDTILTMDELRKRGDRFAPTLNERGRAQFLMLQRMADGVPLGEIARELCERFPERYPSTGDALAHVGRLSQSFSE